MTASEQRDDFPADVGSFALEVLLELPGFVGMKLGGLVILAPQCGVLPDPRFHACAQASLDQQPANFADQDGLKPQCVREKRENAPGDLFDLVGTQTGGSRGDVAFPGDDDPVARQFERDARDVARNQRDRPRAALAIELP